MENILRLGKIEGKRRMGQQRKRWLDSIPDSVDMNLSKLQEIVEVRGPRTLLVRGVHGVTKSQTQLRDCTAIAAELYSLAHKDFPYLWLITLFFL